MNTLTNLKYTLAVTAGLCSSFAYAQNHPHIILIMTDQQRADAIGCMGNDAVISPNLDACLLYTSQCRKTTSLWVS